MPYVGYTGVANQANTSDGFALNVTAANVVGSTPVRVWLHPQMDSIDVVVRVP